MGVLVLFYALLVTSWIVDDDKSTYNMIIAV